MNNCKFYYKKIYIYSIIKNLKYKNFKVSTNISLSSLEFFV